MWDVSGTGQLDWVDPLELDGTHAVVMCMDKSNNVIFDMCFISYVFVAKRGSNLAKKA